MRRLNYHHLLYFWTVAREGTIARACSQLHLTEPTISGQLRSLERNLGIKLFDRVGRHLRLTESGRTVFQFADEIFNLGRELQDSIQGGRPQRPSRFVIGIVETFPKVLAHRLVEPAMQHRGSFRLICEQGKQEDLLARLAVRTVDLLLSDAPVSPSVKIRAYSHLLGECGVSFFGSPELAAAHKRGFPESLDGAPILLPAENTMLRRSLDEWFDTEGIHPIVRGEFADSALLKFFGQSGAGIFAVRSVVEKETRQRYQVHLLGRVESIREQFYAICLDKELKHPAVLAIMDAARRRVFRSIS